MFIREKMGLCNRPRITLYLILAVVFLLVLVSSWRSFTMRPKFVVNERQMPIGHWNDGGVPASLADRNLHGIMFDAGSTGTRIHVFTFERIRQSLRLVTEYFQEYKPGLSSYADNPQKAAESVEFLLQHARREVLHERWPHTPVALKATAGLRLLPDNQAYMLLQKVKDVFSNSPFKTSGDFVSVMDGVDEGVYAWITVNFLLGKLSSETDMGTVGIVDLGGGSCQITFVPQHKETLDLAPPAFLRNLGLFRSNYRVYTHSYLGLGLMAARSQILKLGKYIRGDDKNIQVSSQCFPPGLSGKWSYGGVDYDVSGSQEFSFAACLELCKRIVKSVQSQEEVNFRQFYIFSYFFDAAVTAGLIGEEGGVLSISDYMVAAKEKGCVESIKSREFPFMCMDLSYMIALLRDGYGFHEDKTFILKKRIKDTEVSWALGATLYMFDHGHTGS